MLFVVILIFQTFHETFAIDDDLPVEERFEIKDLGLISRMAEWSGLGNSVPAFLALKNVCEI